MNRPCIKLTKLWPTATTVLLLGVTGCGPSNPLGRLAISGNVTLDGVPLDRGSIDFRPQQPSGFSSGTVITNGIYNISAHQGLPPGRYTVRIYSPRKPEGALPEDAVDWTVETFDGPTPGGESRRTLAVERIPAEYNTSTDKVIEVTAEGSNEFNFDIKSK